MEPLEAKLEQAGGKTIDKNITNGLSEGVKTVLGPVAFAGAATFAAYVAGQFFGDNVPNAVNYAVGQVLPGNVLPLPGLNLSVAIPHGYGMVDAIRAWTNIEVSSGHIAAAIPTAVYVGHVLKSTFGPLAERLGYHKG